VRATGSSESGIAGGLAGWLATLCACRNWPEISIGVWRSLQCKLQVRLVLVLGLVRIVRSGGKVAVFEGVVGVLGNGVLGYGRVLLVGLQALSLFPTER
jgi:hypothetical protein